MIARSGLNLVTRALGKWGKHYLRTHAAVVSKMKTDPFLVIPYDADMALGSIL